MVCCFFYVCVPKIDATHKLNSILCIQCFRVSEIDYKFANYKNNIIAFMTALLSCFVLQIATLNVSSFINFAMLHTERLKWPKTQQSCTHFSAKSVLIQFSFFTFTSNCQRYKWYLEHLLTIHTLSP